MAETLEAILGAVDLDGGSEALIQVVKCLGLLHALLTPVTSKLLFSCLNETTYYPINLVTSSALPLGISTSFTHTFSNALAGMEIACPD